MPVASWLADFNETIDGPGFCNTAAGAVAEFMRRYGAPIGSLVECRRRGDQELVILDLRTGAPQRPVYAILSTERIGILFAREHAQPLVTILRDNFPDTEHQLLVPEGCPATICIDDRPWTEARLTWTPAELIERIVSWFRRAGRGELHDARQPLDPILMGSFLSFFIARSVLDAGSAQDLIGEHDPSDRSTLCVRRAAGHIPTSAEPFAIVAYRVPAEQMKRLKYAPDSLASLAAMLAERGIDLYGDLVGRLGAWLAEGAPAIWRLNARFAVIVEMPIISPRGVQQDGMDHRAFITARTTGDIAVALGIAQLAPAGVGIVGYVRMLGAAVADEAAIAGIQVQSAEVHLAFEPDLAARLAGHRMPDDRKVVLIGAGAIGSHLADDLAREGRFTWTIVDDDRLLPHNLARHVARGDRVRELKANILSEHVNSIFGGSPRSTAIAANLFAAGEQGIAIETSLREADLIIDATASVVAARYISDHAAQVRRASLFFNPTGQAAILLAEPAGRNLTLRDLEAQYLGLVLRTDRLSDHLGKQAETIAYTGACRAITNRIPQSRAAVLSGLAAAGFAAAVDDRAAAIIIWTMAPNGEVTVDTTAAEPLMRFQVDAWQIAIDAGLVRRIRIMRTSRVPRETGGILFGLVDIPAKRIHLVDASPAPPDSVEQPASFVRGVAGVPELIDNVRRRTIDQVRYVGEWHSHPPRSSARPSAIDGQQLDWLASLMGIDSMPALMLIAAQREVAIIFANHQADRLPQLQAQ
jgi:hypothetical protein